MKAYSQVWNKRAQKKIHHYKEEKSGEWDGKKKDTEFQIHPDLFGLTILISSFQSDKSLGASKGQPNRESNPECKKKCRREE